LTQATAVNNKVPKMKANDRIETVTDFGSREDDFSILDLWYNLRDHFGVFCISVFGCALVAAIYGLFASPVYKVDTLIQVQKQQASMLGSLADVAGALSSNSAIEGELDVLKSRSIVVSAITAVNANAQISVDNYFPIIGRAIAQRHSPTSNVLAKPLFGLSSYAWGGERLELARFDVPETRDNDPFFLTIEPNNRWTLTSSGKSVVASGAVGELVKFQVGGEAGANEGRGQIFVSNYLGRPGTTFRIVWRPLPETYEALSKKVSAEQTTKDSSMIRVTVSGENPWMTADLSNAIAKGYVALNIQERSRQARMSLQFLQEKLPSIKLALDDSESKLNQFRMGSNTIDVRQQTEALLARAVDLKRQRTAVQLNIEANTKNFTPEYAGQRALRNQLDLINTELSTIDAEVAELPARQQRYFQLARDVSVNTQLYTSLMANAQQLEVAEAGTTGNVFIVDSAAIPTKKSWPSLSILLSGAVTAGAFFGFVIVQFLGSRRNVLRDTARFESYAHVPLHFTVPASKAPELLARADDSERKTLGAVRTDDPSMEALRCLRSNLQLPVNRERNVVLFTGPIQGVGKSFVSRNVAYLMALNGHRVILIDADLRRSEFSFDLSPSRSKGLAEVLDGTVEIEDVIRRDVADNLDYLPAALAVPQNPAELLDRPEFGLLIKQLKDTYDFVIVDSPPVLPLSDSLAIAVHCDQVFVVSRSNLSTARQLRETIARLETAGVQVTGHIFNGGVRGSYPFTYPETKYGHPA
jgi:tyrosine-protein kinase Etk/Wzc